MANVKEKCFIELRRKLKAYTMSCFFLEFVALFPEARNTFFGKMENLVLLKLSLQALYNDTYGLFVKLP